MQVVAGAVIAVGVAVPTAHGGGAFAGHASARAVGTPLTAPSTGLADAAEFVGAAITPSVTATPVNSTPVPPAQPSAGQSAPPPSSATDAPPPSSPRDRLTSDDDGLNVPVVDYSDCGGQTPLSHTAAAIDTCIHDRLYFVGHNPGVFTPLMSMGAGAIITYWDHRGAPHRLRVFATLVWAKSSGTPARSGNATAEFQACLNADGSMLRNLEAAPA